MPFEIRPIEDKYYPLEEAIQKAAEQNVRRDYRLGIISSDILTDLTEVDRKKYTDEAARLMTEFGVNYVPNSPETERIRVAKIVYLPYDEAVQKVAEVQVEIMVEAGYKRTISEFGYMPTAEIEKFLASARKALEIGGNKFYAQNYSKEIIYVKEENHNG
ncbi:hypothetical protein [Burkholderia phage FLC8]|nr:hypothetical protein [Burkholderia phage FLC8]